MLRAVCSGTAGRPSRSSTKLSAPIRSGAVSTNVPSRSNTTVRGEAMANSLPGRAPSCKVAPWASATYREQIMRELAGKTAFVTGGASGIGLALGRAFAQAGMKVMLADIEATALQAAVKSLQELAPNVRGTLCDVADAASVDQAAK